MIIKGAMEALGLSKPETPEARARRARLEFNNNLSRKGFEYTRQQLQNPTEFPYNEGTLYFGDHEAAFLVQHPDGPGLLLEQIHRFKELGDQTAWSILHASQLAGSVDEGMEFIHVHKDLFLGRLGPDTFDFLFELPGNIEQSSEPEDDEDEGVGLIYVGSDDERPTMEIGATPLSGDEEDFEIGTWDLIELLFKGGYFNYVWLNTPEYTDKLSKLGLSIGQQPDEIAN